MKIAVFGGSGQVATELRRRASDDVTLDMIGRDRADFSKPEIVRKAVEEIDADAVINAAAYTAVDKAEEEADLAKLVNYASVAALARGCSEKFLPLVHISTDYVFDGTGVAPRAPNSTLRPMNVYGESKLGGEIAIRNAGGAHVILRTSWVFSAHGRNFVKTMLRIGAERDELSIVADQIGGPTPAADIADACLTIARALTDGVYGGTYHFAGEPDVSWADFATEIFDQAGMSLKITGIPTSEYPTPATRPLNSRLDCASLETDFQIFRPNWREGLRDVLREIRA